MKIACIATSRVPSTTANSIQLLKACHALAQNGHTVRLYVPAGQETGCGWEEIAQFYGLSQPFEIDWLSSNRRLKRYDFSFSAVQRAAAWGAELVYTWTAQAGALALWRGIPAVLELHDRVTGRMGPWLFRQFLAMKGKKRVLLISDALRGKLSESFGEVFDRADVQIAPNGTDLKLYAGLPSPSEARASLELPERLTVAYTGHFYAGRGMDLLCGLALRFPEVQFLWIGGRPEDVDYWKSRLEGQGIDNVVMTGFIENRRLPLYQAAAEILIMPYERTIAGSSGGNSAEICSPMKMFDYLAAGRAILTSDLPVLHEVLNETNAVFYPPEDLDACAGALQSLVADADRRERLGRQARSDAEKYTWQNRARKAVEGF